jgi:hypothetical protein
VKNQYFGDVNDYVKYGLLRGLIREDVRLLVAWMLTPDDGRSDGKFTDYLSRSEKWRHFDPPLFDFLDSEVNGKKRRSVEHIESWEGLRASFLSELVPDDRAGRDEWTSRLCASVPGHDLVFFDPDNGIEIPSCPRGRRGSSKFLLWDEALQAWSLGASLLIYQHFPREERSGYVSRRSSELRTLIGARDIHVLKTGNVGFFLVPREEWSEAAAARAQDVAERWAPAVTLVSS